MAYIFAADSMGLSSFNFFVVGSERRIFSAIECISAIQGHPRSLILAPIERAYATFYWWLIVTLVLSCTVSEIRRLIGWKLRISHFPLPHSHLTPSLGVNTFEFLVEFFYPEKQTSWAIRQWRFRDPSLRRFHTVPGCDRQTDRHTAFRRR